MSDPIGMHQLAMVTKLARGVPADHGRICFVVKQYDKVKAGLYVYNARQPGWIQVADDNNMAVTNLVSLDCINISLTKQKGSLGSTYNKVTLAEHCEYARLIISGHGMTEAKGWEIWNADVGGSLIKADSERLAWRDNTVYHSGNFAPEDFQTKQESIDVGNRHQSSSSEVLFVNTTDREKLIYLPSIYERGDYIKVFDDEHCFDVNPCTVAGYKGCKINGEPTPVILNTKGIVATFTYQNDAKGWRIDYTQQI